VGLEKFAEVIGRSLGWAGVIYFIVMVFFLTVGYGNLGPLPAFLYGSIAFLCSLVVLLILETLLALNPGLTRKKNYIGPMPTMTDVKSRCKKTQEDES
jgi:hypothetical protein